MKICIVSNSHSTNDVRLYYKLGRSLTQFGEVYIISTSGVVNRGANPHQAVVDATSPVKALPQLYTLAKAQKPDLVICVEPLTMLVGIWLKRKLGCKLIFDVHEFFADAHAERYSFVFRPFVKHFYLTFLRYLASRAEGVTAVNQEILKQLFPRNPKAKNLLVMPNYPVKNVWDFDGGIPASLSQLCNMRFDLIYAGGITRDRGIFKILKCATLLKNDFPNLKILILGKFHDTAIQDEFNDSINTFNLNAVIYYQEWIPPEKIGLLLKCTRFGLWIFNPKNKRMRLATPLKVLEYMAAGLPVVSIKTPLMKSLIERNGVGKLCPYQSRRIASTIADLLRMPQSEYDAMSQRCLDISESRFNWESLEPKFFELIKHIT
ncbi:MAG: glycosyltransferase [Candidatus Cloacimonadaceae bacterium]|jgi:glycosyltransferase involved in cell wall biosynthesis|nr:glycosyltransferase [Candidatus Cloacimonadota bacterium]MDY0127909.1 glycosyltransferase [Candidatus Cloacimonadaceae bacterium]MCB5255492.1 glycosyltransferase [Candidatus Cloacimonadota bacterium]MCK9178414.1 glycosyltransferase [Candidatus Cloacimonadota bacterium]MCK9243076.1 glycosyltransferase [Candidatus Cloacimonadota bacterium]